MENSGTEQGLPHGDLFRKVEYLPLTQIQNTAFDYCDSHRTYISHGLFYLVSPFHILSIVTRIILSTDWSFCFTFTFPVIQPVAEFSWRRFKLNGNLIEFDSTWMGTNTIRGICALLKKRWLQFSQFGLNFSFWKQKRKHPWVAMVSFNKFFDAFTSYVRVYFCLLLSFATYFN